MRHELMRHSRGEQASRLLSLLLALGALGLAYTLLSGPHAFLSPALAAAGLLALLWGLVGLARIPRLRAARALRLVEAPAAFRAEELARMARAKTRLRLATLAGVALLAGGLVLLAPRLRDPGSGLGAALAAMGAALLALALLAEARRRRYVRALEGFLDPRAPVVGETDLGE